MHELRSDARRACAAHRERLDASPVRLALPLIAAVVTISATALLAVQLGFSPTLVTVVSAAVAVAGAFVERRTVSNLAAGLLLAVVRPYLPGETVGVYLPDSRVETDAEVVRVGAVNTTLATADGLLVLPNRQLLRTAPEQLLPPDFSS